MRRDHTSNKWNVDTCFPVFNWVKCEFCNSEYQREKMYTWITYGRFHSYGCTRCVASISHCNDTIDHQKETKRAQELKFIPPPPPMITYRDR